MEKKQLLILNRVLLGLVMLIPGVIKLVIAKPEAIVEMLSGIALFSWSPVFWAWILILSEIVFGIAILANYKLKYTIWPPIVILMVATFTAQLGNIPSMLTHLALVSNYFLWGLESK